MYFEYRDVRDQIKDGSIVFFEAETFGQKIITAVVGGKYSHVGIACWMADATGSKKLFLVEATEGGRRLVNLASYDYRNMRVVDVGLDWNRVSDSCLSNTGFIKYGYFSFVLLGLKKLLHLKITERGNAQVCSEFVAETMHALGYDIDSFIDPDTLFENCNRYTKSWLDIAANTTDMDISSVTVVEAEPAAPATPTQTTT